MKKRSPTQIPDWYRTAAKQMAQTGQSLKQVALENDLPIDAEEAEYVFKRQEFRDIYIQELNGKRSRLANMPGRDKSVAIGTIIESIEALVQQGEHEKVISGVEKLAKMEGWIGPDSNVNVYAGLTAKDIAEEKKRILEQIEKEKPSVN